MTGAGVVGHRPNRRSQVTRESLLETVRKSLAFGEATPHCTTGRRAAAFSTLATAAQSEAPLCKRAAEVVDSPYRGLASPGSRAIENLRAALPRDPDDPERVREIATLIRSAMHGPASVRQPGSYAEFGTAGRGLTNAFVACLEQSRLT